MKICPVCNDSFSDDLNFCDIDGVRLTREDVAQERNKWWSLVGAGLLIGAVAISVMTIFLPKARVASPAVSSEAQQAPAPPNTPAVETSATVAAATAEPDAEPERADLGSSAPEIKKKDKALANSNSGAPVPNPKAAALASEGGEKNPTSSELRKSEPPAPKSPETPPTVRIPRDGRIGETSSKPPQPPPDLKSDRQPQPAGSKANEKNSSDKKKSDDKDKKKGGFLKVFKKIFGKG